MRDRLSGGIGVSSDFINEQNVRISRCDTASIFDRIREYNVSQKPFP